MILNPYIMSDATNPHGLISFVGNKKELLDHLNLLAKMEHQDAKVEDEHWDEENIIN
jgi:hypothetical protein